MATRREQLRWASGRLMSMPPRELPHRLREQWRRAVDRERGGPETPTAEVLARPVPAWPLPLEDASLRAARRDVDALFRDGQSLLAGSVTLLGVTWPSNARSAWNLDPETGHTWPTEPCAFDVPLDGTPVEARSLPDPAGAWPDVKPAWELLRLQHLQTLALAARVHHEEDAAQACVEDLAGWLAQDRPGRGVAWAAGIEVALRVVSLLVVAGVLGPTRLEPLRLSLVGSMAAHARWLRRYPSLHSSANNHRVAELGALVTLATVDPVLAGGPPQPLVAELAHTAGLQLHGDGAGSEQSPTYQAFTTEWLLLARAACLAGCVAWPAALDRLLERSAAFLVALADERGRLPRLGDDDEGVVLRRRLEAENLPLSVAACVGCALGRPELVHPAWQHDLRAVLLGLPLTAAAAQPQSVTFPEGGLTVLRRRSAVVVVDHGPLGWPATGGHGHADALALCLTLGGVPVLVDTGTFRYNGRPSWRAWARSTAAHNTVQVAGLDQSTPTGPFNWGQRAHAWAERVDLAGGLLVACHDGYRGRLGVVHRREVHLRDGGLDVEDVLLGGEAEVAWHWHFAPDLEVHPDPDRPGGLVLTRRLRALLRLEPPEGGVAEVLCQAREPGPGAHSPGYNRVEAAPCVRVRGRLGAATTRFTWA